MTNQKSTKRAIIVSLISILLCFTMLLGSTYAWFTDEVISKGNKIQAGRLEIDMLVRNENGEYISVKNDNTPIFDYALWEPGYTAVANVKVKNTGTLALQYGLQIITDGLVETLLNGDIMLSDVIDVYYAPSEVILADRAAVNAAIGTDKNATLRFVGTLTDIIFGGTMIKDTLLATEEDYATIVLKMRETAGNEYKNLSVGTSFDFKLYANQYTYEPDSFDNQYDKIELPSATMLVIEPKLLEMYNLDAGCVYLPTEQWNDAWDYDAVNQKVTEGTPEYAFYFADYVISFSNDHAADEITLWGSYPNWNNGAPETFQMNAITAGEEYRVIKIADEKLPINMVNISYNQLLTKVESFSCGVVEGGLADGETVTVTLRMYKTNHDGHSFYETGEYFDVAVYTYTK